MKDIPVNIYTDGACAGNQERENRGGYGAILEYGPHRKEIFGGEKNTTNNRMEMTALISALKALNRGGLQISVFSDSAYLINCMREGWYVKWQKNGWKNGKKAPVENRDLWELLIPYISQHDFRFYLVKGHVDADGREKPLQDAYRRFTGNNGDSFSYGQFIKIVEFNNRADELANQGIDSLGTA